MKNKGFTLIELLAVIVILAIIALIATPTILGVVEDARRGAAEQSVLGFIDAVEKQAMINEMDDTKTQLTDTVITDLSTISVKGQRPTAAYAVKTVDDTVCYTDTGVKVVSGEVQDSVFVYGDNKYNVTYVQPVDMFPMTSHVETILCLSLRDTKPTKIVII